MASLNEFGFAVEPSSGTEAGPTEGPGEVADKTEGVNKIREDTGLSKSLHSVASVGGSDFESGLGLVEVKEDEDESTGSTISIGTRRHLDSGAEGGGAIAAFDF